MHMHHTFPFFYPPNWIGSSLSNILHNFPALDDVLILANAFKEMPNICMNPPKNHIDRNTQFDIKQQLL